MSVFAFLIWIIFIFGFVFAKGKKENERIEKQEKKTQSGNRYAERQNQPVRSNNYRTTTQKNFAVMPEQKKVSPNVERNCAVEDRHRSENNIYKKNSSSTTAVPNTSRPYTELPVNQKMSNKKRMKAMRLYEGDHVPQGYRMVKCKYCAAENLIAYSAHGDYMCYFCNTDL